MHRGIVLDALQQKLDRQLGVPLIRQVYLVLRQLILSGELPGGARLPASRMLAQELGLSRNTVLQAYETLQAEGYTSSTRGSGTYVSSTIAPLVGADASPSADANPPGPAALSRRAQALLDMAQASPAQWGPFVAGVPDVSLFPQAVWLRLLKRRWREQDPKLLTYAYGAGHPALRAAVAQHLRVARYVRCEPDQVLITSGIHQSLSLIARLLADEGESAWVEDPAYWGAGAVLRAAGINIVPIPVDDEGMAPASDDLSHPPRFIFVTPSHQYPLGTVMSLARRSRLLEYARQHGAWIVEDDYDSEFRFDGRPLASLQGLDEHERVLYLGTFSKTLYPGIRLGYMVLPRALMPPFEVAISELYREGRLMDQAVLADFMVEGHYAAHVRRARAVYAKRQLALRRAIYAAFGADWPISTHDAGLHLVMHLPHHTDDVGIVRAARARGLIVRPLSAYYAQPTVRRGLLFGYASVPEARIASAFAELAPLIREALA